jgi:hypothetical protein
MVKHCMRCEPVTLRRLFIGCALVTGPALPAGYPEARLEAPKIQATVYLPDASTGFYHGLRFDWAGIIGSLKSGGHEYYGPWFSKLDPSVRDFVFQDGEIAASAASAATGPAEEFQTPLGYDSAKPGGTFVKPGVGVLRKTDDAAYSPYTAYQLVDTGKWSVKRSGSSVEITQLLDSPENDYKYIYTKTIRLIPGEARMVIEHTLRNTGGVAIRTKLYDHNFLTLDHAPIGPNITVILPFEIKPVSSPDPQFARIDGKRFVYLKTLVDKDRVTSGLQGFGGNASDYDIRVENRRAGAGVRIRGDHPLDNLSLWSIRSVMAVEPFIQISVDPQREVSWKYTYDYYSVPRE